MIQIPRQETPRPDFSRRQWLTLNGEWDFSFDQPVFDKRIIVPFSYEAALSGIGDHSFHNRVWYRRSLIIPAAMAGKHILLHFGAVDYESRIYVNGSQVMSHTGGQTGFFCDITEFLRKDENGLVESGVENELKVYAFDDPADMEMPRGKQYWKEDSESIFYTRTTGIWQPVWIEAVENSYLTTLRMTPVFDEKAVEITYEVCSDFVPEPGENSEIKVEASFYRNGSFLLKDSFRPPYSNRGTVKVSLAEELSRLSEEEYAWTPEHPNLLDVTFRVYEEKNGETKLCDTVDSYFGLRSVTIEEGFFCLNHQPYFQKLVLDQGYWPESLLTAPSDEAFIYDIQALKDMGFNGVRKHQKVEDPRYLYHADRMGFLVWGEIGAAYVFSPLAAGRLYKEWMDNIEQNYNHPSIVVWTPENESWGVTNCSRREVERHQEKAVYELTKSLDMSRLCIDNDGWEHVTGDLFTIHDYDPNGKSLEERYKDIPAILASEPCKGRPLMVGEMEYNDQPILVTEYGGIRLVKQDSPEEDRKVSWGYSEDNSPEAFLNHYKEITEAICKSRYVQGFCYTQITDVEQEQNGLMNYDRSPKFDFAAMKEINDGLDRQEKL